MGMQGKAVHEVIQPEDTPHPEYMEMSMYKMSLFGEQLTFQQTQERTFGKFRNGRGICYNDEPLYHRTQKLVQLLDFPDDELDPIGTGKSAFVLFYLCICDLNEVF